MTVLGYTLKPTAIASKATLGNHGQLDRRSADHTGISLRHNKHCIRPWYVKDNSKSPKTQVNGSQTTGMLSTTHAIIGIAIGRRIMTSKPRGHCAPQPSQLPQRLRISSTRTGGSIQGRLLPLREFVVEVWGFCDAGVLTRLSKHASPGGPNHTCKHHAAPMIRTYHRNNKDSIHPIITFAIKQSSIGRVPSAMEQFLAIMKKPIDDER